MSTFMEKNSQKIYIAFFKKPPLLNEPHTHTYIYIYIIKLKEKHSVLYFHYEFILDSYNEPLQMKRKNTVVFLNILLIRPLANE